VAVPAEGPFTGSQGRGLSARLPAVPPLRRTSLPAVPWEAWRASILALADAERFSDAVLTVERALDEGQSAADLLELLEQVEDRAPAVLPRGVGGCLSLHGLRVKVRLTGNARSPEDVLNLVRAAQAPESRTDSFPLTSRGR